MYKKKRHVYVGKGPFLSFFLFLPKADFIILKIMLKKILEHKENGDNVERKSILFLW